MDKKVRRELLASVDATGKPKWVSASLEDLGEGVAAPSQSGEGGESLPQKAPEGSASDSAAADVSLAPSLSPPGPGEAEAAAPSVAPASPGAAAAWPPRRAQQGSDESFLADQGGVDLPQTQTRLSAAGSWVPAPSRVAEAKPSVRQILLALAVAAGIFLVVALPRLYVLFHVTDPENPGIGWYGDVFHHWQIAYLSDEIGFSQGFLRLWDFKGMEYFWGLLHPLVLVGLFRLTGSVDIIIPRLLSALCASGSIVILFFLLRRYFNTHVAVAGVLLAGFNPIAVFNDSVGMQEPLGVLLLFTGILLWPRRSFLTGMAWALAGMVRAEYWVFGAGLLVVALITERESNPRVGVGLGWGIPTILYMKYMLDSTGNAIYPVYWNYLAGTAGAWVADIPLNAEQIQAQWAARIVLVLAASLAAWLLWKRPKYVIFLMLGLGNIMMLGIVLGLGAYVRGYITRVLIDRLLVVPYMYVGILLAVGLLYGLPRGRWRLLWVSLGWMAILGVLAVSQVVWQPILSYYGSISGVWTAEKELATEVASFYEGGTICIPEDRPGMTYALVEYHGVTADHLLGQMYDPFAYASNDPFADWGAFRGQMREWLSRFDIRLMVFYSGDTDYQEMIRREPNWFQYVATVHRGTVEIYRVAVQ
jgi:hypothetical protein